jgi:WS/DGAT/MGAT family acyltransferase
VNERHERLSSSDMSSLLAERGPIHVNVGGTIVLEGKPPAFDDLLEHVDQRLNLVPRFRQKVTPLRLNIDNPVWTDDSAFDLRWHVRHTALPKPGSGAHLRELVGRVMSQPLDFARPLWQIYLVEGLEGERCAVISKTHHALVDGVSASTWGRFSSTRTKTARRWRCPPSPGTPMSRARRCSWSGPPRGGSGSHCGRRDGRREPR